MSITIGENIKKLRKQRNITQEILAEHLAVTPQAISRWESGVGYPAIDYLPDLAGFFGISVDELLGVKLSERESRREHIYREIDRMEDGLNPGHGYDQPALELLREAHAEFPGDRKIRLTLARALFRSRSENQPDKDRIQEAELLLRELIRQADEQDFRFTCICELASLYKEGWQDERGYEEVLNMLPGIESCREYFVTDFFSGTIQKTDKIQECIVKMIRWTSSVLRDYISYILPNSRENWEQKIRFLSRLTEGLKEVSRLLDEDKARCMTPNISELYRYTATYHLARNDGEKALECLEEGCRYAGISPESRDVAKNWIRHLEKDRYDSIRNTERFRALYEHLEALMNN